MKTEARARRSRLGSAADYLAPQIGEMRARGVTWAKIARTLGHPENTLINVARRAGLVAWSRGEKAPPIDALSAARALLDFGLQPGVVAAVVSSAGAVAAARTLPAGPKPALGVQTAGWNSGGNGRFAVFALREGAARVRVSACFSRERAYDRIEELERMASWRERACLGCRGRFLSEGFHHRMCGECRSGSVGPLDFHSVGVI